MSYVDYAINLVVSGFDLDSEEQNAGLDCLAYPAIVGTTAGVTSVDATVPALGPVDAFEQLRGDLKALGVSVVRIDLGLVGLGDIAERLGVNRETARLWSTGARREGFPAPEGFVGDSRIWRWSDVADWATRNDISIDEDETPLPTDIVDALNGALAEVRSAHAEGWLKPTVSPVAHLAHGRRKATSTGAWANVRQVRRA